MSNSFQGQIALVTGATRGIGRAIAIELARQGVKVIGTATSEAGAQAISEALSAFEGCKGVVLNVTDAPATDALVDSIVKEQGALHILVNNAGITRDTLAMRMKDDDWDAVIDTNLKAVFRLSRAVMRPMMKQRQGRRGRHDPCAGPRTGQSQHHGQLCGPRFHRHGHDQRLVRRTAHGPQGPDPAGPSGPARRHCPRRRFPGVASGRLHHRHRNARQRRHVHDLNVSD
jgi:hypothetical protein